MSTHPETATFSEFAAIAGFKRSYVPQLKAAGRLVLTEDGKRVRVAESLARIEATKDPSKAGVAARHAASRAEAPPEADGESDPSPAMPTPAVDGYGYQEARAERERWQARLAQLEYERESGKLMAADDVASTVAAATTTLRSRLESLPDTLAPQLAAISDEGALRALLADAIEHALDEVSRQFAQLAKAVIA